jgi:3'(2'), 5'-bisphosphate nucleotidase
MNLQEFEPLKNIVKEAGNAILKVYNEDIEVTIKLDQSPLTKADLASHQLIKEYCKTNYPHIDFLSEEESSNKDSSKELTFICDPLDGTKEFIAKNGEFTVNLALVKEGRPILGLIYVPTTKILYYALKGKGAYMEIDSQGATPIHTSSKQKDFILVVSRSHLGQEEESFITRNREHISSLKQIGSSLKGCHIASGDADLHVRFGLTSEWDLAAMDIIVHESGGILADLNHHPLQYRKDNVLNPYFYIVNKKENVWIIEN